MKRAVWIICEAIVIAAMWAVYTDIGRHKMSAWATGVLVLTAICLTELDAILVLAGIAIESIETGNIQYVRYLEGEAEAYRDKYFEIADENRQLQRDATSADERAGMNGYYLEKYRERYPQGGAQVVTESNGQFASADGMSREEKQRRAAELSEEGWSRDDIAAELNISKSSAANYISHGRKILNFMRNIRRQDDENLTETDAEAEE